MGDVENRKVLVVFGTRPEAIKLFPLIHDLAARPGIAVRVCVSAQHREMLNQVLAISGIIPDVDLDLMQAGQSLDGLTARLLLELGRVFDDERPDRVVVQGDTATAMVATLAAYYRKIPVSHVEAGLRSGDIHHPWPEEVNRRIISTIADQHFAPTETAAEALRRENVAPATIHVTGIAVSMHCCGPGRGSRPSQLLRLASTDLRPGSLASGSSLSPATGARISAKAWRRSRVRSAGSLDGAMSR